MQCAAAREGEARARVRCATNEALTTAPPPPPPCAQANPLTVETRISLQDSINNWNMHTQSWLAKYIFFRSPKSTSRYVTFLASAFWHGFKPGYYFTFFNVMVFQDAARALTSAIDARAGFDAATSGSFLAPRGASLPLRLVLWAAQFAIMTVAMTYAGSAFMLFELNKGATVYDALYWFGHAAAAAAFVLAALIAPRAAKAPKVKGGKAA